MLKTSYFVLLLWLICSHPQVLALEANRKGDYTIITTINELLGEQAARKYEAVMTINEDISWQVTVPATYDPAVPAGVMVYISPSPSGEMPKGWKSLMNKHNLIWIAADKSGNKVITPHRITFALLGSNLLQSLYSIDKSRIYVAGFSGGGRVSSILATRYPEFFKGAIYNSGVTFLKEIVSENFQSIKNNRYVFITGRDDFNFDDTKRVYRKYKKTGLDNLKLMIIPRHGHSNPNKKYFEKAIMYLDGKG